MTRIPPRRLLTIALICLVLAVLALSFVGCGESPTAPSSTRIFGWTAAPGCSPELPIPSRRSEPLIAVKVPGSATLQATWVDAEDGTLTVQFQTLGQGLYLVCSWSMKEAA